MSIPIQLQPNKWQGLSRENAANNLKQFGFNELPRSERKTAFKIAWHIISEPMILLLIACGSIYFILGDTEEAMILIGCIGVIIGITFYQEAKTEKALEALRDLSSPRALVIREGETIRIAGREVVVDDLVVIDEGDRVPADGVLVENFNLEIDESILTGESLPARKTTGDIKDSMPGPGVSESSGAFSGTLVVRGHGLMLVRAVGKNTEIGKIGKVLNEVGQSATLLQTEIKKVVFKIAVIGVVLCLVVAVIYALTRNDWLNGMLSGLALAMGILPEEFPLVLTIFLALGAWRISKSNVLTRNLPAVENLGSITVLCVDKTGTITHNKMSIKALWANGGIINIDGPFNDESDPAINELLRYAQLTTRSNSIEPMDLAIMEINRPNEKKFKFDNFLHVNEYALSQKLLAISHVWRSGGNQEHIIASKGAPEAIIELCHLNKEAGGAILKQVEVMASQGLRVLGVAKGYYAGQALPDDQHEFNYEFIGLIGMADTVRSTVKEAVAECYRAGIRVIMITGDHAHTAQSIGRQILLRDPENVITGAELSELDDEQLRQKIINTNIFSRVVPEQKLRIIKALKANGEIVAMTGDGVNDAPALKSADIGIAMGKKGTDVARESADLVLLDDDFSSIVKAIKMGRTIFLNLKKAMSYIVAIHIPIAGMSLVPVLFKWPLVLLPVQIVFMELVVDPACSLVFENTPPEKNIMDQRPRRINEPMFNKSTVRFGLRQGIFCFFIVLSVFLAAFFSGRAEGEVRAMTFATLVLVNMGLIFINFSWSGSVINNLKKYNLIFWLIQAMTFSFLLAALYIPYLRGIFKFDWLSPVDIAVLLAFAGASAFLLDRSKTRDFGSLTNR